MSTIEKLVDAPDNVRGDVGDVSELADSIKAVGLLSPIIAREGDLMVVVGARRLAAAKLAKVKEVPVIIRAFTEQERLETMLVENLQREDLSPLEEAVGFQRLAAMNLTQRQIATRVGCSQAHVSKRIGLLSLPTSVQVDVAAGKVTSEEAAELAKLKDPKLIEQIAKSASSNQSGQYVNTAAVSQAVKREVEKAARDKKQAAEVKRLEKEGHRAVALAGDTYGHYVRAPEGMASVSADPFRNDEVQCDPKKHAKLDCHVFGVKPDGGLVPLCSEPKNHPSPASKRKAEEEARRKDEAAAKEAWVESVLRRREFVGRLLRGKIAPDTTVRLAWLALNDSAYYYGAEEHELIACDLLEIVIFDPENGDVQVADPEDELFRLTLNSGTDRARALAALAAAKLEAKTSVAHMRWNGIETAYLTLLKELGYEPSAPEAAKLELFAGQAAADAELDGDEDEDDGLDLAVEDGEEVVA